MRLMNTTTLELKEIVEEEIPPYAILSHTWYPPEQEILFEHVRVENWHELYEKLGQIGQRWEGYLKVKNACALARKYKFGYIWIDACCINKESSAELSEAINSMYRYYHNSRVCYAYLVDVPSDLEEDPRSTSSRFRASRWFTRGWTLQELLAPSSVVFVSKDWEQIGTRASLQDVINGITRIPIPVLLHHSASRTDSYSLAQKMSWAANRVTTRPEDLAYSLMGIFDVNMPSLYGEGGTRAFIRLQEEIIKYSTDESIFAWCSSRKTSTQGLLAHSPSEFAGSAQVIATSRQYRYSTTNYGLHIRLRLIPVSPYPHLQHAVVSFAESDRLSDLFLAKLHCISEGTSSHLGIFLRHEGHQRYVRVGLEQLVPMNYDYKNGEKDWDVHDVFVKSRSGSSTRRRVPRHGEIRRCFVFPNLHMQNIVERYPLGESSHTHDANSPHVCIVSEGIDLPDFALMKLKLPPWNEELVLAFGCNDSDSYDDQNIWCDIVVAHGRRLNLENIYQSFCQGGGQAHLRTRALDRVTKALPQHDLYVTMAIYSTATKNEYIVEVDSGTRRTSPMLIRSS
ncbi:HET-domain-containing protein [Dendrothele bispora CBS 962.96]|uniref:HET-domain-containing protein n=1 Tax=Dendrothele bispora (strain CBS 962.96) TaxID=1314807 RepID=A0A4V4HDV0_DENBC|nr:HET-domain-containing protein [Dendrothele bispora CBS 962.96]